MTHTHQQISYAEAAYAARIDRILYDACDFEEVTPSPEYHLFEGYIARDEIEVFAHPFTTNPNTFYIDTTASKIEELGKELEAYLLADDAIVSVAIYDNDINEDNLVFIRFKNTISFTDAAKRIIDAYGYVAFCCDKNIEIETDLPF